jgi:hypothetical protein
MATIQTRSEDAVNRREQYMLGKLERELGIRFRPVLPEQAGDPGRLLFLPSGTALEVEESLSPRERALITLLLGEIEERRFDPQETLEYWVRGCVAGREPELPEEVRGLAWKRRVPLLMSAFSPVSPAFHGELEEVCRAYFAGTDPWLVEAGRDIWVVFVPLSALGEAEEPMSRDELRILLLQGAEGWAEAVASEAGKNLRLIVHPPLGSAEEAAEALAELGALERLVHRLLPEREVSGSWQWEPEKLAAALDPEAALAFLRRHGPEDESGIPELRRTLEAFFRFDLNVSETARHLYIHRNTLLYRLDRFRRETGLDVRKFEDAVIARLWLVLSRMWESDRSPLDELRKKESDFL